MYAQFLKRPSPGRGSSMKKNGSIVFHYGCKGKERYTMFFKERLSISKILCLPRMIYRFNAIPVKNLQADSQTNWEVRAFKEQSKEGACVLSVLKTWKAADIKTMWYWIGEKQSRTIGQNRGPETESQAHMCVPGQRYRGSVPAGWESSWDSWYSWRVPHTTYETSLHS